jgi:hypothetical protein
MIIQDLTDNGYHLYKGGAALLKNANTYYAKMLRDSKGKKYQIVVYVYDRRSYPNYTPEWGEFGFMPEVQFRHKDTNQTIDIIYHVNQKTTLTEVESYYERMWNAHYQPYYELWINQ